MADYKLTLDGQTIVRTSDGANIPLNECNRDYRGYLAWIAEGNTPDPADPLPPPTQAALNRAEVQSTFEADQLHGRTPAEIKTLVENQIDGWTTLTQAKTGMKKLFPIMAQAIAWLVIDQE